MLRSVFVFLAIAIFCVGNIALDSSQPPRQNPQVVVETSLGNITLELFRSQARVTVVNFLTYVQAGYYDGTIFHRVIRSALIQGGGLNPDLSPKTEGLRGGILNEATNGLQNERGTIAMARLSTPNSARAQFFINTEDNNSFNHRDTSADGFGYAVFGQVIYGMDVVDKIARVPTRRLEGRIGEPSIRDVPRESVVITAVRRVEP
jgi:cyclophilin family peptidyl-prolyl cis-trans isomerase